MDQGLSVPRVTVATGVSFAMLAIVALLVSADQQAEDVRSGAAAQNRISPFRAWPAELRWKPHATQVRLTNGCRYVRLLGTSRTSLGQGGSLRWQAGQYPCQQASVAWRSRWAW